VTGQGMHISVPTNDRDSIGGHERPISKNRGFKRITTRLFAAEIPLLYAWT
jgi:hypothetical protein